MLRTDRLQDATWEISDDETPATCFAEGKIETPDTEPLADRGPQAGRPLGVVDASGCRTQLGN
ncbi:MAG TPA: hypothetical protein DCK93_00480 [Blastocatellia bacterium]|nr:hypothetical protein [Blastocatellia bacterium]